MASSSSSFSSSCEDAPSFLFGVDNDNANDDEDDCNPVFVSLRPIPQVYLETSRAHGTQVVHLHQHHHHNQQPATGTDPSSLAHTSDEDNKNDNNKNDNQHNNNSHHHNHHLQSCVHMSGCGATVQLLQPNHTTSNMGTTIEGTGGVVWGCAVRLCTVLSGHCLVTTVAMDDDDTNLQQECVANNNADTMVVVDFSHQVILELGAGTGP